jgi:L-ectoine synthase
VGRSTTGIEQTAIMIIRTLDEIAGTERDVSGPGWRSRRILRRSDGMDHSLHWTEVAAGSESTLWYKHHLEANLCISGEGEVVNLTTGESFPIRPGTVYALDQHDRHLLRAHTDLALICVFTPALSGSETHDEDGSYVPASDA